MSLADHRLDAEPCKTDATCLLTFFGTIGLMFLAAPVVVWLVGLITRLIW
ncbi:hypothetical protein [Caulobacter mirabilis]|nr:hypothetical protein [Caulobacter mirabilis]